MNNAPRTTREALIAEILGDLHTILDRVDNIPGQFSAAERDLINTITLLNQAGDKYRMTLTSVTEDAKKELADYLGRKAETTAADMLELQRSAMNEAALKAFNATALTRVAQLSSLLMDAINEVKPYTRHRLIETLAVAFLSSGMTIGLVKLFSKLL